VPRNTEGREENNVDKTNLQPVHMTSTTEQARRIDRAARLARASRLARLAVIQVEPLGHDDVDTWEAVMSLLNAIANLKRARGE